MGRVTRDDWIDTALELLASDGPQALTIERLCAALQKTKGSFYHHFRDAAGLRDAILDRWEAQQTEAIIAEAEREPDLARRGELLDQLAAAANWSHERTIRAWAWRDATIRPRVEAVDQRRIGYLATFYPRIAPDLALMLAFIEYAALVGAQHLFLPELGDGPAPGELLHRALAALARSEGPSKTR